MIGASFGEALEKLYPERLNALVTTGAANHEYYRDNAGKWAKNEEHEAKKHEKLYGLTGYFSSQSGCVDHASIDGSCGMRSVEDIAEAIGLRIKWLSGNSKQSVYVLTDTHPALYPATV